MKLPVRHLLFYFLPMVCNFSLIAYVLWTAGFVSANRHQFGFRTFTLFYAIGGVVMAVSAATAFMHGSSREGGDKRLSVLALVNAIIPTLLLLIVLQLI